MVWGTHHPTRRSLRSLCVGLLMIWAFSPFLRANQTNPNLSKHSALKAQNNIAQGAASLALGNTNQGKKRPVRATDNLIIQRQSFFCPFRANLQWSRTFPKALPWAMGFCPFGAIRANQTNPNLSKHNLVSVWIRLVRDKFIKNVRRTSISVEKQTHQPEQPR